MRKRWISGGQDFVSVGACFVVVAFACTRSLAQDAIVFSSRSIVAPRIPSPSPAAIDLPEKVQARIESAKHRPIPRPPAPIHNRSEVNSPTIKLDKKGLEDHRTKIKQENVARDEIKKSSDEVKQEARLIALDGQGITFEQRRLMKDEAAQWRRQLRLQLIGNVIRVKQIDDGLDEAKRVAREQARKLAEEAKSQTRRE
jgi:hypothetical protein